MWPPGVAGVVIVLLLLVAGGEGKTKGPNLPRGPSDVRRLLGGGRMVRRVDGEREQVNKIKLMEGNATPMVLLQVLEQLGGGHNGACHVLVYYDPYTAPPDKVKMLQDGLGTAVTLVDVSKMKFSLITRARRRVPLLDLLTHRPDSRCRLILAWASTNYQRGLLFMARAEPGVLRPQDTLVFSVQDRRLDRFLPRVRHRVLVKKRLAQRSRRGRRDLQPPRFLVESTCDSCARYSLHRLGEWQYPGGWKWGGATSGSAGLGGITLTVAYTPSVPNIFPVGKGEEAKLEGVELRLLQYASTALNFTYRLVVPPDGEWGRPVNGTWTGKVGMVMKGRADVAVGGLVYTAPRAGVVEYSVLFHNERWGIVCPLPVRLPVWPYIMFPFRTETASPVFTFLIVLHLLAFLVATLLSTQQQQIQGPSNPLTEAWGRVARAGVSLYLRLMACLYFWNLYFCIIKPKYEAPLDSSIALLRSGPSWGIVEGTTVEGVLSASHYPEHRDLVAGAIALTSISEGFLQLREGICLVGVPKRYALATIATRHTTECGEAGLQVSEEDLNTVQGGWILSKGSKLTPMFNKIIRRLQGFGLIELWRKELHSLLITQGPRDLPCLNPPLGPLSVSDLRLAFYVLLAGWGAALLIFLTEYISFHRQSQGDTRRIVHRDTGISDLMPIASTSTTTSPAPTTASPPTTPTSQRPVSLRGWLVNLLSPVPALNVSAKEVIFRQQLQNILQEIWGGRVA